MRRSFLAAALLPLTATAAEVPAIYERTAELVQSLYLEPNAVTPEAMLHAAAEHLSDRIDWLRVRTEPGKVTLLRGASMEIGTATVTSWADLPVALYALETALRASGHDLDEVEPRYETLDGATTALDRYSRVLVGDGLDRFDARLKGTLVGIGARLRIVNDGLYIVGVFGGGPAERAGLMDGDHVVRIDGVSTHAMPVNEAVRRIRGEVGSYVQLHVERPMADASGRALPPKTIEARLARAEVVLPNVVHEVLEGGVGYLRIDHISQKTVQNLRASLAALRAQGGLGRGLVLDLRGNSGGSMKESAGVVDAFVDAGLLLSTAGRDGKPVPQLMDRIEGRTTGDEIHVPMVVLVDSRTASGAEIIAGALQEHERAALVGQRTYGKGKVQKIYDLDTQARLKLTVAEYVLANDRRVAGAGLGPDLVLGRVYVNEDGVRLGAGWNLVREDVAWEEVVPVVSISKPEEDELEEDDPEALHDADRDVTRELARRAVLAATDRSRDGVVAALRVVASALRTEEQSRLAQALTARGLDWSPAPGPGSRPEARVQVSSIPAEGAPGTVVLRATVENHGPTSLYQGFVRLVSEFGPWHDQVIPVGRIASGASSVGEVRVQLPPGLPDREDHIQVELHADRRPALALGQQTLRAWSTASAQVKVEARLLGEGAQRVVRVTVRNLADRPLEDVEAELAWPYDVDIELLDRGVRTPSLVPGASATFDLGVRLGPGVPPSFPLRLALDAAGHGRLLSWELPMRLDGTPVDLEAPEVMVRLPKLSSSPGPMVVPIDVTDEGTLRSVVVFLNGEKILWDAGGQAKLALKPPLELIEGVNVLTVRAIDDEGISTRRTWTILGVSGEGLTQGESADPSEG